LKRFIAARFVFIFGIALLQKCPPSVGGLA
jgi:hypothetical protein